MNETERGRNEIEELLRDRSRQYTHAIVRSAIALDRESQWRNCLTTVQLYDGQPPESKSFIYLQFEIHEVVKSLEEVVELVRLLVENSALQINDREIPLTNGLFQRIGIGSQIGLRVSTREGWILNEWPGNQYLFWSNREINPPSYPLIAPNMPAYPDASSAIEHLLKMETNGGRTWDNGVYFFFPDYRARIDKVTLGTESLSIAINPKKLDLHDLLGKLYVKGADGELIQDDMEFGNLEERIDIGFQPEKVYFGLICKSDNQILDDWRYSPYGRSSEVTIESFTPEYVQQLLSQGENNRVEFKPGKWDDSNNKKEIAESAIAFANKNGGIIIVGVDDNAIIMENFKEDWEDMVSESLRDRCDPPIEPIVRRVNLENGNVYLVLIEESKDKPHLMKGTGVTYVRVGSTDKPATRYELEELFREKVTPKTVWG